MPSNIEEMIATGNAAIVTQVGGTDRIRRIPAVPIAVRRPVKTPCKGVLRSTRSIQKADAGTLSKNTHAVNKDIVKISNLNI